MASPATVNLRAGRNDGRGYSHEQTTHPYCSYAAAKKTVMPCAAIAQRPPGIGLLVKRV